MSQNIKVCIRMRPLLQHEDVEFWQTDEIQNTITTTNFYNDPHELISESYNISITNNTKSNKEMKKALIDSIYSPQKFSFDKVYSPNSITQNIYKDMCKDVTKSVLNGFNCSIFMYGQTTSGKTFTMLGSPNSPGILPCSLRDVFRYIENNENENISFNVYCSYIEIYNENIHDLLTDANYLKLIDDNKYGVVVAGAKRVKINNFNDGIGIKDFGEENRKYRETLINEYSSRSHSIFQIFIESNEIKKENDDNLDYSKNKYSCLNLIDLAGSERINEYENKNDGTGETGYINKSLFVLANVINKLAENKKNNHIPYRDSKLTRLLSQALGGNSMTTIICTVSPASVNYYQTLSTLRFAMRAKNVKLKPNVNEFLDEKGKIEYYKNEVKRLKNELMNKKNIFNEQGYSDNNYNNNEEGKYKTNENYEDDNFRNLYLNEKIKCEEYKRELDLLKKQIGNNNIGVMQQTFNPNFNLNNNLNDNHNIGKINEFKGTFNPNFSGGNNNINTENNYIDNVISQYSDGNIEHINQWQDETNKLSQEYKNALSNLKSDYENKIKNLHNTISNENSVKITMNNVNTKGNNIYDENYKKTNLLKNINPNMNKNSYQNSNQNSNENNQNLNNYLTQEIENFDNDDIIEKIKEGTIFNSITLNFQSTSNIFEENVKNLRATYESKIDILEKTMDYYKSYIENYYRKKIQKTRNTNMDSVELIEGNLPIMTITNEHNNSLKKLRELYDAKIKELETIFFATLRNITAKRMDDMTKNN